MDSRIQGIHPLWNVFPSVEGKEIASALPASALPGSAVFADVFRAAIDNVRQTDDEKSRLQYLLSTGQLDNPAELSFASYKADVALDLLIQLRSKALDAYSELMRISM